MPLQSIPVETLLDNLLPYFTTRDVLSLTRVSKFWFLLCSDDTFWKRKLKEDYNFTVSNARVEGFKVIYKGIRRPSVYVWGSPGNGRLGLGRTILDKLHGNTSSGGVPTPTRLKLDARIVQLAAGGWFFNALDDLGRLHVWGTMDGERVSMDEDFAKPSVRALSPLQLDLGDERISTVSCGRKHAVALGKKSLWIITSWGRPFRLITPHLDNSSPESKIVQLEAGWESVSVLTETGNVFILWPFEGRVGEIVGEHHEYLDENGAQKAIQPDNEGVIHCQSWSLELETGEDARTVREELLLLPPLPSDLPELLNEDAAADTSGESSYIKLVKIAAGVHFIIGLTNKGHVLKMSLDTNLDGFEGGAQMSRAQILRGEFRSRRRQWEYLPLFSETEHVRKHPTFASALDLNQNTNQDQNLTQEQSTSANVKISPPDVLKINHVSANFKTFFAYSTGKSSVVITGKHAEDGTITREIVPELQNRGVIAVTLGDYTFGALTSDGELLTWGKYQAGSLGLGDPATIEAGKPGGFATEEQRLRSAEWGRTPPEVKIPTPVTFGKGKKKFCFAAVAAGWHFGALVLNLDGKADEEEEGETAQEATPHDQARIPDIHAGDPRAPPIHRLPIRGVPIMRVGFAGRGARGGRGGGPARGQIPDELNM